jgi:UDP-glucose 4-epimerase
VFEAELPDVVDHHAAQIDVRRSVADPQLDASINILGSLNLLELSRQFGVRRFVYSSTGGAVYGEPVYLPCDEDHPVQPISQYGASKHAVEHYLFLYHALYGLEYVVLRYPNVYGPRQDPNGEGGVVAIFSSRMLRGLPVTIFGDGEQERDFVYVEDCARANLQALESEHCGIFNLASGQGISVNALAAELKAITAYMLEPEYGPARLGETRKIYLDASLAGSRLGWEPGLDLRAGLQKTVDYFRSVELELLAPKP